MTTETEKDDLTTRRKKFQEANKVPGENEASKIKDTLEGTTFSMTGSEKTGYEWGCPACKASNTHSANISKRKGVLSFLCSGCNRVFDIVAAEEIEEAPEFTGDQINEHTWGIEVDHDGSLKLRLGNWTDTGWYWDGGPEMILGFLARMGPELNEVLDKASQHPVILAKLDQAFEAAKANPDAIAHLGYVLSGDNAKWHFGGIEDALSKGLERDLEEFPGTEGPLPDYRAQIEEEVPYEWARSLSDKEWKRVFSNAAGNLNWTPTDAQRDKFCTDLVEDLVRGNDLSMEDFSSFVQSLSEFGPDTPWEYINESLSDMGDQIFEAQIPKFLDDVRGELDQLEESVGPEGESHPRRVDPNHPKLPFAGSRKAGEERWYGHRPRYIRVRTVNLGGKPISLSLVPGDLRRENVLPRDVMTCGTCGRSWDDEQSTSWTPTPSSRCPFEYYHPQDPQGSRMGSKRRKADQVDQIIAYEQGDMSEEEMISFFQGMIDSGLVWKLQGHYGRTAKALIDAGLCTLPEGGPKAKYQPLNPMEEKRRQDLINSKTPLSEGEFEELKGLNRRQQLSTRGASRRKAEDGGPVWTPPNKEEIARELLGVCQDILENGEHRFSDNNGWFPSLTVNMHERLQNAVTDAVAAGIGNKTATQRGASQKGTYRHAPGEWDYTDFARVSWSIGDVLDAASQMGMDLKESQARVWINRNHKTLQENLVSKGWDIISDLLTYDPPGKYPTQHGASQHKASDIPPEVANELLKACRVAYACLRRPDAERDENRVVNLLLYTIAKAERSIGSPTTLGSSQRKAWDPNEFIDQTNESLERAIQNKQSRIFECGGCDQYHPLGWTGDCRDDANRYANEEDYAQRTGLPIESVEVVDENSPLNSGNGEHIRESKQFKKVKVSRRSASPLQEVSREAYSSFIRTLDGVQETTTEEPVGQRIKILKGSIPVAEAFYPTQGDPVYQIAPPPGHTASGYTYEEEEDKYINHYRCPYDETEWDDTSPYTNNDRCPKCNKEIEPYESEEIYEV